MENIIDYTAVELGEKIKLGVVTAIEVVEAVLEEIEKKEKEFHCYITIEEREKLIERAIEVQKQIEKGRLTEPLAGVPVAIKDNICTKNIRTTCGSNILENFKPFYSAKVVTNLEQAGAIIIGKTNMDEFAMGNTTKTSAFGVTKNPWNIEYVSGGSSGGSAAAVVGKECFYAIGSDTGGSIRQPSAFCGVVGIKPTYGTVSRYGLVAYASSLEQIGPIAKDVTDCATILETIADYDKNDSTSYNRKNNTSMKDGKYDFTSLLREGVKGMKIGIPKDYMKGLDKEIKEAVLDAGKELERQGAMIEEFDLSFLEYVVPTYYTIACAEASSNLSRFDGVKYGYRAKDFEGLHEMYKKTRSEGFGVEVKKRIMLGSFVLSDGYYEAYYLKALKVRNLIKQSFCEAFKKYDMILGPVTPTTAPKILEQIENPLQMYLSDIYTVSANLAGIPAISVPFGMDKKGLPIGIQLMGNYFEEAKLFRSAYVLEQTKKV